MDTKRDYLIDALRFSFAASPDSKFRQRATDSFETLVRFLQENGLTRRVILGEGERPTEATEIRSSDLTDEGNKVLEAAHTKWVRAFDRGAATNDTSILAGALAQVRGGKLGHSAPAPRPRVTKARASATAGRRTSKRVMPSSKKSSGGGRGSVPHFEWNKELESEFKAAGPKVYDKAKWHYEGEYPAELGEDQAFVHTGMFVGWLIDNGMIAEEFLPEAQRFKRREITGPQAYELWDGVLADDMLTEAGNRFAREYYGKPFAEDYKELLVRSLPSFYHVKDSWENYGTLKQRIDERYAIWKAKVD